LYHNKFRDTKEVKQFMLQALDTQDEATLPSPFSATDPNKKLQMATELQGQKEYKSAQALEQTGMLLSSPQYTWDQVKDFRKEADQKDMITVRGGVSVLANMTAKLDKGKPHDPEPIPIPEKKRTLLYWGVVAVVALTLYALTRE
jgi:hypothetical protein